MGLEDLSTIEISSRYNWAKFSMKIWERRSEFCDAEILCEDGKERIPFHKIVLATASTVFSDILGRVVTSVKHKALTKITTAVRVAIL